MSRYLQALGAEVQVTTGQATAALRRSWRLDGILAIDSDLEKNRADHRHHAIDALVIALTSRKLFLSIARLSEEQREVLGKKRFPLPPPWPGFMDEVRKKVLGKKVGDIDPSQQDDLPDGDRANRKKIDLSQQPVSSPAPDGEERVGGIVVSHQPLGKITGAFHEETAYGRIEQEGREAFVRRVPLESLTAKQVEKIVDARVRELVSDRMAAHDNKARDAFANKPLWLEHSRKRTGRTRIRTVRVAENLNPDGLFGVKRQGEETPFKYYAYGNNHHVEIIENAKTGRRKGVVVTAMEAARRARQERIPIVRRDHGAEWRFVMSLSINDMVRLDKPVNGCELYRVQKLSPGKITLRPHTSAKTEDKTMELTKSANELKKLGGRKVSVGPLGKLETAHDQANRRDR